MNTRVPFVLCAAAGLSVASVAPAQQLVIVDNLPGQFIDISKTGTPLNLSGDLESVIFPKIGNTVYNSGRVVVGNNGGVGFDPPSDDLEPLNTPIGAPNPAGGAFGNGRALLAFWDDIGNDTGDVFWEERFGVAGNNLLIIQWNNHRFVNDDGSKSANTGTFQVQIPSFIVGGVVGQMLYADIEQAPRVLGGISATIGHQNGFDKQFNNFEWSFNEQFAVRNGTVLSVVIPAPATGLVLVSALAIGVGRRRR